MNAYQVSESKMTPGLQVIHKAQTKEKQKTVRVAAYCRVSTDFENQRSSLEIQMESFERLISCHPGWELAGIYADRGLTGTNASGRAEFQRMMNDAENGRIDYIIAKSMSRFARNTVDTLVYTRRLRECGVGVYFEEQKLDTGTLASEMLLTIYAAFAQEESHSISENLKKAVRSRFEMGIPKWSNTYGITRDGSGKWLPDGNADTVREIFERYTGGQSVPRITGELNERGIAAPGGGKWYIHSVAEILHNEKYAGDVAMQKNYTVDHITHRRMSNGDAALPRYYSAGHHPAIVDRETFEAAQTVMAMRDKHCGAEQYPFYGILRCPFCGENMVCVRLPVYKNWRAWTCGGKPGKTERCQRTACPEFFVRENSILTAENSNYLTLSRTVQSMTFALENGKVNWNKLVIKLKNGETAVRDIEYTGMTEIPVTPDAVQYIGKTYYANGSATAGNLRTYKSVQLLFGLCRNITIEDGERVPVVKL